MFRRTMVLLLLLAAPAHGATLSPGDVQIVTAGANINATDTDGPIPIPPGGGFITSALLQLNDLDVFDLDAVWTFEGSSAAAGAGPFTTNPGGSFGQLTLDVPIDGPFAIQLTTDDLLGTGIGASGLYYFENPLGGAVDFTFNTNNLADVSSPLHFAALYKVPSAEAVPTPEPATAAMICLGVMSLVLGRRSRA